MDTPIPIIDRLRACAKELEVRRRTTSEAGDYGAHIKAERWTATISTLITLLELRAVNNAALMMMEMALIQSAQDCLTSLDMRGMLYVNVYLCDRALNRLGGYIPTRDLTQTFLCYQGQEEQVAEAARKSYAKIKPPRPLNKRDHLDDFSPSFEVVVETHSPLIFDGIKGVKNISLQ